MSGRNVCIIADDTELFENFHNNLVSVAEECGLEVRCVESADKILSVLEQEKQSTSLFIVELGWLDLMSEDERKKFKNITREHNISVIGIGYYDEDAAEDCRKNGVGKFILKYHDPSRMLALIREAFNAGRYADKRKYPRVVVDLEAFFGDNGGEKVSAEVLNVSLGGMFIKSFVVLPAGSEIGIVFSLGDKKIHCKGKVAHSRVKSMDSSHPEPPGMGVAFTSLPEEAADILKKFIEKLLPTMGDM